MKTLQRLRVIGPSVLLTVFGGCTVSGASGHDHLMPATTQSAAEVRVSIDNFSFAPEAVTVPVGAKVVWTNRDDVPHTVTANDKSFTSRTLDTDDQYTRVFNKPGTYPYFCAVHPHMTGKVIVK